MTRLTLSDEMSILNELSYIEEALYFGRSNPEQLKYTVKTIKNLLLEFHLTKSFLSDTQLDEMDLHIRNAARESEAYQAFEANKPI